MSEGDKYQRLKNNQFSDQSRVLAGAMGMTPDNINDRTIKTGA